MQSRGGRAQRVGSSGLSQHVLVIENGEPVG